MTSKLTTVNTRSFLKPLCSKQNELCLTKPFSFCSHGSKKYYYLASVGNFSKFIKKYGLTKKTYRGMELSYCFFTKEEIDKVPKCYRRGGEYGHDTIKIIKTLYGNSQLGINDHKVDGIVRFCKVHDMKYIIEGLNL